ncbi:Phosphatidyl-N-methylethanolamine N-methyltransferase [Bacidia gigantensis]|uniref:Phosphatidyl-N-methylethanolamine N-methyltransferase n=1 Tax=Bacidia gigantensis TaxID=2732470 RepID=UPI001D03FF41|nr:Phosphatidyl-N-methylethanolamine N-methyltransferase [Bacidia gigantensis]KAG8533337.1 Phosphatidyl-N-methylethanolamine N-methyltransferase [Bacidia gigantensis]
MSTQYIDFVDLSKTSLYLSAAAIIFNPTFWNVAARSEYNKKTLTRLFGGKSLYACYALAVTIFGLGLFRDSLYERALRQQPLVPAFQSTSLGYLLLAIGNTLVLSSFYQLGITGTFLGDYFGILLDEPVTGFPFSVTGSPMYWGSATSFLGTAIWYGRPAGALLTALVVVVYYGALQYEEYVLVSTRRIVTNDL